ALALDQAGHLRLEVVALGEAAQHLPVGGQQPRSLSLPVGLALHPLAPRAIRRLVFSEETVEVLGQHIGGERWTTGRRLSPAVRRRRPHAGSRRVTASGSKPSNGKG